MNAPLAIRPLLLLGEIALFGRRCYGAMLTTRPYAQEIVTQTARITWTCLPMVLLVAMFIGANVVVQGVQVLRMLGAEAMVGTFAALVMVRELAPVLAGAMVSAKAGSEIASQLATMRIRGQIDAIEVMGVDAAAFLVVPRLIGSMFAMVTLTIVAIYGAVGMGWFVATQQFGINGPAFLAQILDITTLHDLRAAVFKAIGFGATLSIVQSYFGFHAEDGPQGVGMATNQAVVSGAVLIGWVNLAITGAMY